MPAMTAPGKRPELMCVGTANDSLLASLANAAGWNVMNFPQAHTAYCHLVPGAINAVVSWQPANNPRGEAEKIEAETIKAIHGKAREIYIPSGVLSIVAFEGPDESICGVQVPESTEPQPLGAWLSSLLVPREIASADGENTTSSYQSSRSA